ncbi:hypothetical protein [Lactobacillus taiwanensis]|uniref:Uncharacterized protein n=1 Tax=Lactobacillus taiwanensis TaxID=508451 RepID=A0A256L901_9LACO|nr:hypothetical protein [Lactobacillus taiwanensis]OYR86885.1 hypothetical protein CBF53_10570 [Lactobacillus taiwanensis]OYR89878.1 hypothetical protein CBF70_10920 [Lactobacillus taiwanensis]OYR91946.1 hypothetical protein CBF59_04875 [Lactobacillus taiwanensis]OYR93783.1 hypothetical protein CBF58_11195 [Lactobacillus taiwanensis]
MKKFDENYIDELIKAGGVVLQNVHGQTVAVGMDSEYPDTASFLADYIEEFGINDLVKKSRYTTLKAMIDDTVINAWCNYQAIATMLFRMFDGLSADEYAKKLEEKQWHLGDIVEDDEGHKAMIIQDDNYLYKLLNVNIEDKKAFKTFEYFVISDKLNDLQRYHPEWHKVVED